MKAKQQNTRRTQWKIKTLVWLLSLIEGYLIREQRKQNNDPPLKPNNLLIIYVNISLKASKHTTWSHPLARLNQTPNNKA